MHSLSKDHLANRLRKLHRRLKHAFSTEPATPAISSEDLAFLERIANALVQRNMGVPASLFLESMGPMNFLGSQALHALTPIIECAFNAKDIERVARLLERRDTVAQLVALIEAKASMPRASAR